MKPISKETAENEQVSSIDRGIKGQGEIELPSAVYVARGLNHLSKPTLLEAS